MEKKNILRLCLSFLMLMCFAGNLQAQQSKIVTGTIVDELGDPIIGASIKVEGTTTGTISDMDGKFSISAPEKSKLTISFIGYVTQTISDLSKTRIVLKEDQMNLDEVVVVGYGSQKMKNITGAVEVITTDEIKDLSAGSLGASLGGLVNGLSSSGGFSRPGESANLRIRQSDVASAYSKGSTDPSPLYIIDDYIASADEFNNLDVSEVESITVLKDAAAAVYGSRAAQGAILVKTKRGKEGAPRISYSGQFGYTDALYHPKMMSAFDYGRTWNAVRAANTTSESSMDMTNDLFQSDELEAMKGLNYDLLEQEWSAAFTQRHSLNMSGGTERATYFAGISYYTQDGNMGRLDYNRWNYRTGVDVKISKWLKASVQLSGNYGETNKAMNKIGGSNDNTDYNHLLTHLPYIPNYVNGLPIVSYGVSNTQKSDLQLYNYDAVQSASDNVQNMSQTMNINGSLEYDFGWNKWLKGLKVKASYSKNISTSKGNEVGTTMPVYRMVVRGGSGKHLYTGDDIDYSMSNFEELTLKNGDYLSRSMSRTDNYQLNFIVTYSRKFGLHDVSGLFTIERAEAETEDLSGKVFSPLSFTDGQSSSGTGDEKETKFNRTESAMLSYVGRINYSYADKYLLEFQLRSDASTNFAPENYWGKFPSVSAGWVISEENWFNKEKLGIDFLKIRGSFGLLGKDNIAKWGWVQLYNRDLNRGGLFGSNSLSKGVGAGVQASEAPNRDAHWDKTYKMNFGIDARFLDGRLSVGIDGYYDKNRDVFMNRIGSAVFPTTVGTRPTAENFGKIDTYGVEISLGWKDKIGKDFSYWVKLNTGYSDNKIIEKEWPTVFELDSERPNERRDRGLWGLECIGMFRTYQQIEEYFDRYQITNYLGKTKDDVHPGMLIYRDVRGKQNEDGTYQGPDGIIDATNDRIQISKRNDNKYGFTVNFGGSWKSLSFSAQFGANWGGYTLIPKEARSFSSSALEYTNLPVFWKDMFVYQDILDANGNVTVAQNHNAKYPNLMYDDVNSQPSTFWKLSATRIALRNLTIAYTLPKEWLQPLGISSCRLNLTGQNVLNFYNPYPENFMDSWAGSYGKYPNLRKFTLGVNITF